MKTIWKYPLRITDAQSINIPEGAQFLSAQIQNGTLTVWALVDSAVRLRPAYIYVVGTGNAVPDAVELDRATFLSTVQQGPFVWHIFVGPTAMRGV